MNTEVSSNKKSRTITAIAILLLLGTGVYLSIEIARNNRLTGELMEEKLSSETLLSEKLSLDKELVKLKLELKSLQGKNVNLDKALSSTTKQLENAQQALKKNQNQSTSLAHLKKQNQEMRKMNEDLEQQVTNFKTSLAQLQSSNDDLTRTVALLQDENKKLKEELEVERITFLNNVLAETSTTNKKLTVKAKRTRIITFTIDVPAQAENLKLKVTGPDGKEIPSTDGDLTVKVLSFEVKNTQAFYVTPSAFNGSQSKRVEMIYKPKVRLNSGVYKIEVLGDSRSIGGLQVKLR